MPTRTDDEFDDVIEPRQQGGRPGAPVDPGRVWLSIKRDWRWIPLAAATWGTLGLLVAFLFIKHTYKAEAVLVWQARAEGRTDDRQLATEAGSIKLPHSLRLVRERLKLGIPVKTLEKQIEVWFDTRTNMVTVGSNGRSARDSMVLTNTILDVFLEDQRNVARARADEVGKALEKDVAAAHAQLAQTRKAFDAFRSENGVADIEHETQLAIDNAAHLKEQAQQARADATTLQARIAGLGTESKKQQRTMVQGASSSDPDAQKLAELRTELATARARYSADHPRVASLEAQVAVFAARAGKGHVVSSVTTGTNPEYQALQSSLSTSRAEQDAADKRVKSYEQFAQAADARVSALTALQGKARSFVADIDLVQKRITDLETQLSEARDAARTPQIEWRVLTPAVEPEWPEQSKRRLIAGVMPIGGMLVALLALVLRPLIDGRVYTAREAAYWANVPVLGSSAWPRNREMFFTLIDELGDYGVAARGYTLVLGASGREKPFAEELAYWLGGNRVGSRQGQEVTARVEVSQPTIVTPAAEPAQGSQQGVSPTPQSARPIGSSEALVPISREGSALGPYLAEGTHAWLGAMEGPALRHAARMADRVIVLLTSGAEVFTSVAALRTRIGRERGVGVVLLGLGSDLLNLPDRAGDVQTFWRSTQPRRGVAA